jgi:Mg2+-importing ATPase
VRNRQAFWAIPTAELLRQLRTTPEGLSEDEAEKRLTLYGSNLLKPKRRTDFLTLFVSQFKSPIILILLFAAVLSLFLHDSADALFILIIVLVSGLLGFWQEKGAVNAVEKLLAIVGIKAAAIRDGNSKEVPVEEIVPGDIVSLNAGQGNICRPPLCSLLE